VSRLTRGRPLRGVASAEKGGSGDGLRGLTHLGHGRTLGVAPVSFVVIRLGDGHARSRYQRRVGGTHTFMAADPARLTAQPAPGLERVAALPRLHDVETKAGDGDVLTGEGAGTMRRGAENACTQGPSSVPPG